MTERPLSEEEIQSHIKSNREASELTNLTSEHFFQQRERIEGLLDTAAQALHQNIYEKREHVNTEDSALRPMETGLIETVRQQVEEFFKSFELNVRIDWDRMTVPQIKEAIEQAYNARLFELQRDKAAAA